MGRFLDRSKDSLHKIESQIGQDQFLYFILSRHLFSPYVNWPRTDMGKSGQFDFQVELA